MNEELQQAVETGKINEETAKTLQQLAPGSFCQHKSWGFGQVSEWRLITGQIIIDFDEKKGHSMQLEYAAGSLTIIPEDHIMARARHSLESVKEEADKAPVQLVRSILEGLGGKATVDQIGACLVPEVFEAARFKRWWDSTKKKLKADGHFHLPSKKTQPVELLDEPVAAHTTLLTKFRGARHLKDQVSALDQLMKSLDDFAHEVEELKALTVQIEDAAGQGKRLQAAQALELLIARDDILDRHESLKPGDNAPTVGDILRAESSRLPDLFAKIPAAKQRQLLESMEDAFEDEWQERTLALMQRGGPRLAADIYRLFEKKGCLPVLMEQLAKWIAQRAASTDILYWICKERKAAGKELFDSSLFGAVLAALELDQLAEAKKSMRLRDLLIDDRELLGDFLADCDREVVRDAMRRLLLTTVFDDLNRRSLIGRLIKLHPELQSMVSGDSQEQTEALTVSWASLERRKAEFDDLVNRVIPQNVKDIQIARSYGDLRENFEFKSAKEQQAVLSRQKAELERALGNARGTNFENPDTSVVSIGTTVTLRDDTDGSTEVFSILGAWDSAPDKGLISYKAAIGQALLGKKPGEAVTLADGKKVTIEKIDPFTNLDILVQIAQTPTSAETSNG